MLMGEVGRHGRGHNTCLGVSILTPTSCPHHMEYLFEIMAKSIFTVKFQLVKPGYGADILYEALLYLLFWYDLSVAVWLYILVMLCC